MKQISHRNRIENCLAGHKLDQIPVALWRHFPVDDQNAHTLAAAITAFQNAYDFDFIKVTPASSFCLTDWGVQDEWNGHPHGTRAYNKRIITKPEDWESLPTLSPTKGQLGMILNCLGLLVKEFEPTTPIIQTIFNPLAQAKNLAGENQLLVHMRTYPDSLHAGLKIIADTTINFLEEVRKTGIDGIFYAIQHAQYSLLTKEEFEEFGKKYDLEIQRGMDNLWLNIGHIHGKDIMFDNIRNYPFQVLNWHDRETYPSLVEAQSQFPGVVCGGIRQEETLVLGSPHDVKQEAIDAIRATHGIRFILGTGCVAPIITPHGNIVSLTTSAKSRSEWDH